MSGSFAPPPLDIALVNNASRQAFDRVVDRFRAFLAGGAGDRLIRLHVARLPHSCQDALEEVETIDSLMARQPLDAAIVTGAEPTCQSLEDEPFWAGLTAFLDHARIHRLPLVLSCLAAHAAVQHATGLRRRRLAAKCFGVFSHHHIAGHDLLHGVPAWFDMPHSRWNELRADDLLAAGYDVLTCSERSGVDMFVDPDRPAWLFLQGHPEYTPRTLIAELRRDVARFRSRETTYDPVVDLGPLRATRPSWTATAGAIARNWLAMIEEKRAPAHPYIGHARSLADRGLELSDAG